MSINIGFLEFGIFDLVDITLVAILLYQLYRLLKGSLAINIFSGLLAIFLFWFLVRALGMELMEGILGQFLGLGFIGLLIVFQPEVRKFLLYIGRNSQIRRFSYLRNLWTRETQSSFFANEISEIKNAVEHMASQRHGAILVFARTSGLQFFGEHWCGDQWCDIRQTNRKHIRKEQSAA